MNVLFIEGLGTFTISAFLCSVLVVTIGILKIKKKNIVLLAMFGIPVKVSNIL